MFAIKTFARIALTVSALALPQVSQAETLADAMTAAYRNSNLLDQNRALLRTADEDVAVAVANVRPVVSFTLQSTYTNTELRYGPFSGPLAGQEYRAESLQTAATLSWDLTLIDFGRNKLAIEAAKETVLATREALVDIEQRVLITAVQAYVNVRLSAEIVDLRRNNVRLIEQELQASRDRFDVGEITRTDVSIAESRLASSRANLASAEGDYQVAREAYKAATGAYPKNLAAPPRAPKIPNSLDEARSVAVRNHPAIRQAQHEVLVADLNVARAEAQMKPTIGANASVGVEQAGVETTQLTLSLNQTIYAGGRLSALLRRAQASREATRAGLHQTTVIIEQNVGNAWSNLSVAGASIEATNRQISAAQTAYDGVREEAKLGARTTLDVLNAEQELLDARASRLSATATQYFGVYSLLQSMGLLTVDHMQLGIPTYDVTAYYNVVKSAPTVTSKQGRSLDRVLKAIGGN